MSYSVLVGLSVVNRSQSLGVTDGWLNPCTPVHVAALHPPCKQRSLLFLLRPHTASASRQWHWLDLERLFRLSLCHWFDGFQPIRARVVSSFGFRPALSTLNRSSFPCAAPQWKESAHCERRRQAIGSLALSLNAPFRSPQIDVVLIRSCPTCCPWRMRWRDPCAAKRTRSQTAASRRHFNWPSISPGRETTDIRHVNRRGTHW